MPTKTPEIGRRRFIVTGLAAAGGLITPAAALAQARARTPAQTEGPFYPTTMPSDTDNDLVLVRGSATRAQGTVAHVTGRLTDVSGRPIANAQVEIWQCDANGVYLHPRSPGKRDGAFQGFGRVMTDADGKYTFRTIKPVPYTGRTPHIHFAVTTPDRRSLTTQMYVAGEAQNARDGLYRSLGRLSELVTVRFEAANGIEQGALAGEFNIVI